MRGRGGGSNSASVSSCPFGKMANTSHQLVCCLALTTYLAARWPLQERFFISVGGGDERQSASARFGVDWAGPVSLPGRARPSQAVPAPQRASVQRGTGGQDAWPRISYHSEFCSCHWHLARGNNGRDNSCRYRPIHLFMPLLLVLLQAPILYPFFRSFIFPRRAASHR